MGANIRRKTGIITTTETNTEDAKAIEVAVDKADETSETRLETPTQGKGTLSPLLPVDSSTRQVKTSASSCLVQTKEVYACNSLN